MQLLADPRGRVAYDPVQPESHQPARHPGRGPSTTCGECHLGVLGIDFAEFVTAYMRKTDRLAAQREIAEGVPATLFPTQET